jgi:hypothetical protein
MTETRADAYTCADCGGTFPKGWSDEEAAAERDRDFPRLAEEDMVVVCDDCYQAMRLRAAAAGVRWSSPPPLDEG